MDETFAEYAKQHITHLLQIVTLDQETKDKLREDLNSMSDDELKNLSAKLELIHHWEIQEDIDERIYALEANFDEWMENMKKGLIDKATTEKMKEEEEKVKNILSKIKEVQN